MTLPPLPPDHLWSAGIYAATQTLESIYTSAMLAISQGGLEHHRIIFHEHCIAQTIPGLLQGLYDSIKMEGIPDAWLQEYMNKFISLITLLGERRLALQEKYVIYIL